VGRGDIKDDDSCSLFLDTGLHIPSLSRDSIEYYPHSALTSNIRYSTRERELEPPHAHGNRPSSGQIIEQQHRIAGKTKGDELSSFLNTIDIVCEPVQCDTRCFGHQNNLTLKAFCNHATGKAIGKARETNPENPVAVLARKDTGQAADQSVQLLKCWMKTIAGTRRLTQKFKLLTGLVPVTYNTT
jgi:hypothetical protein